MKKINHLKEINHETDEEFEYGYVPYKKDYHVKTSFEKIFGISLRAAYVSYPDYQLQPKKNRLDWDAQHIILVRHDGNLIYMNNSEWAVFELIKK